MKRKRKRNAHLQYKMNYSNPVCSGNRETEKKMLEIYKTNTTMKEKKKNFLFVCMFRL